MHRTVRDAEGVEWVVWQVTPIQPARRDADTEPIAISWMRAVGPAVADSDAYAAGWLAFRSDAERRRLAPFPFDWAVRSDDELRLLLASAPRAATP
jgi:hypothetical protein